MAQQSGPEAYSLKPSSDEQIDAYYERKDRSQLPLLPVITAPELTGELPIARVSPLSERQQNPQPTKPAIPLSELLATNGIGRSVAAPTTTLEAPQPEQEAAIPPAKPPVYESRKASAHRTLLVGAAIGSLALVTGAGVYGYEHAFNNKQTPKPPAHVEAALVPGLVPNISPSTSGDDTLRTPATLQDAPETATPRTTTKKPTKLSTSPKNPHIVLPPILPQALSSTSSLKRTPDAPVKVIPPPTPEQPTPSSSTTTESAPLIGTAPSKEAANLLGSFADKDRVRDLKDNYQNVDDYLHAAKNGELDFLNTDVIKSFQDNLSQLYKNQSAAQKLGTPPWLSADTLRTMQDSGSDPARQATEYTDNTLRSANTLFPLVGDMISKAAFCNNQLSDNLTQHLQNGEDVSRPDSSDQAIAGDAERVNDVYVVPIVASYITDKGTVNVFSWDALVPLDTEGRFVSVAVWQQELEPKDTVDNTYTSTPTPEPTDTSTPEDSSYSDTTSPRHNNKSTHDHHHRD